MERWQRHNKTGTKCILVLLVQLYPLEGNEEEYGIKEEEEYNQVVRRGGTTTAKKGLVKKLIWTLLYCACTCT